MLCVFGRLSSRVARAWDPREREVSSPIPRQPYTHRLTCFPLSSSTYILNKYTFLNVIQIRKNVLKRRFFAERPLRQLVFSLWKKCLVMFFVNFRIIFSVLLHCAKFFQPSRHVLNQLHLYVSQFMRMPHFFCIRF